MRKGQKASDAARLNMRIAQKGKIGYWLNKKRAPFSEEWKRKIGDAQRGNKGSNWKGGVTLSERLLRKSTKYKNWRKEVLKRDKYRCTQCGSTEKLEVDHINSFTYFPVIRFLLRNGRTLCHNCHIQTENYGRRTTNPIEREAWKAFR